MMKMNKNILYVLGILAMFLVAACSQTEQPAKQPQPAPPVVQPETQVPTKTSENSIGNVGTAIDDIGNDEGDLDDSDLEDLDSIL